MINITLTGSVFVSGDSAAYTAMAQQQARLQKAQQDRLRRRRDAAGRRAEGEADASTEALGCPQCKATYDFGTSCLDCDVFLVSASMVDQVEPQPVTPPINWRQRIFDTAMISIITITVAGGWFFYLYGGWARF